MRVFAYIARDYESAAEATSLLSSVASLAIKYILNQVNPAVNQRIYFTVEFQELLHQFRETRLNIHSISNAFTKTWLFTRNRISSLSLACLTISLAPLVFIDDRIRCTRLGVYEYTKIKSLGKLHHCQNANTSSK